MRLSESPDVFLVLCCFFHYIFDSRIDFVDFSCVMVDGFLKVVDLVTEVCFPACLHGAELHLDRGSRFVRVAI